MPLEGRKMRQHILRLWRLPKALHGTLAPTEGTTRYIGTYRRHYTVPTSEGSIIHNHYRNSFGSHNTCKRSTYLLTGQFVSWLRRSVVGLPPLRPGSFPGQRMYVGAFWQSGMGTGFSSSASTFPCHYHPTCAPQSYFINLPPLIYNIVKSVVIFVRTSCRVLQMTVDQL